jgi:hypothetical protein
MVMPNPAIIAPKNINQYLFLFIQKTLTARTLSIILPFV